MVFSEYLPPKPVTHTFWSWRSTYRLKKSHTHACTGANFYVTPFSTLLQVGQLFHPIGFIEWSVTSRGASTAEPDIGPWVRSRSRDGKQHILDERMINEVRMNEYVALKSIDQGVCRRCIGSSFLPLNLFECWWGGSTHFSWSDFDDSKNFMSSRAKSLDSCVSLLKSFGK